MIGTKFIKDGKHLYIYTVIDKHVTTNSKGEIVKTVYVAETDFAGQIITDYEVSQNTIEQGAIQCS